MRDDAGAHVPRTRPPSHQPLRAQWDPTASDKRPRPPRPERTAKKQTWLGRFVANYGWRAYAIPVLAVLTVFVVFDAFRPSESGPADAVAAEEQAPDFGTLTHDVARSGVVGVPPKADGKFATTEAGVLPDGGPFTESGPGAWHVVPGGTGQVGAGTERVFTYSIEVEDGLDTAGFGGEAAFAQLVDQTLSNPKSWTKDPRFAFRRIDNGEPDFRVALTSQTTAREACGFDIPFDTSCYNLGYSRVVLSVARWVRGAIAFQGDVGSYRQYLVNHEVGHAIGYQQHQPCDTDGGLAPAMMQQTFGTGNNDVSKLDPDGVVKPDGKVCRFNPWPYPRG